MKTLYRIILPAIIIATLFSCSNPRIEITRAVTVNVNTSAIIEDFVTYKPGQLDLLESDEYGKSKLHIVSFIYNRESGELVWQDEGIVSSFGSNYSFKAPLEQDLDFVLLCFAYSAFDSDELLPSYSFDNVDNLLTLKVRQNYQNTFYSAWSILGGDRIFVYPWENELYVSLRPLTSYVSLQWTDIHSRDLKLADPVYPPKTRSSRSIIGAKESDDYRVEETVLTSDIFYGVDKYGIIYHNNDYLYWDDSFIYATSLSSISNNAYWLTPSDYPEAQKIYSVINLFPGTFNVFGRAFIGNDKFDTSQMDITIWGGQQYVIELDCDEFEISYRKGQLKSTRAGDNCVQYNGSVKAIDLFESM